MAAARSDHEVELRRTCLVAVGAAQLGVDELAAARGGSARPGAPVGASQRSPHCFSATSTGNRSAPFSVSR